jgi:ABC-type Fe3+ transport system substrate-binding protein
MTFFTRTALAAVVLAATAIVATNVAGAEESYLANPSYPLSSVEQLYADLAKLDPKARQEKLLEGAKKEPHLDMIQTIRGREGKGLTDGFRKAFPMLNVKDTDMGSQQAMERLVAEERSGRHITDVSTADTSEQAEPLDRGYIARFPSPSHKRILPQFKTFTDPYDRGILTMWSEQGMSYNPRTLKALGVEPPKQWFDLCKKEYAGEVSFDLIRARFLVFLHEMMGEEKMIQWMKCIGENKPVLMDGQTVRLELMLGGDHAIQGVNYLYAGMLRVKEKGKDRVPFEPIYSAPLLGAGSSCVINRMAANPYSAALYCDYRLTDESQELLKQMYRGPVVMQHPYIPDNVELIPVNPKKPEFINHLYDLWNENVRKKKA